MIDTLLEWMKKYGIGWEVAIDFGLLLMDIGKRLAEKDGVAPEVLAARESAAQQRLSSAADALLDELLTSIKP